MPTINPKLVTHGTVNGTAVQVDLSRLETGFTKRVTLSMNYAAVTGPGIPARPCFTGCAAANLDSAKTIPSGTTLTLLAGEAAALVAAGAASYA